jgi:signal transduction histidine kinase
LSDRAQRGVARSLVLGGTLALLVAVLFAVAMAGGLVRPLRRMAGVAARVEAGDLSARMVAEPVGGSASADPARHTSEEVRVLADAFDRMLTRLEDAFARQRAFVADASHELRTPLTAIRGQLEVLAMQPDPAPADVRHVERIVQLEVERMSRMTDDLLLLVGAEDAAFIKPTKIALVPWVAELFESVEATGDRRFVLADVPDVVLDADPDRLAQALRNLCNNAIQHTRPGGLVRLAVTLDGEWVVFAVDDDGPGIPVAERARVFDRFHRADSARSRREGGAGLGLAIVRAIVEAHGGVATAEASPEGGARVGFRLALRST